MHSDTYCIRVRGHLDKRWSEAFAGMVITWHDDGTTTLEGPLPDQAALYGVLAQARDLGLALVAVSQGVPQRHKDAETIL